MRRNYCWQHLRASDGLSVGKNRHLYAWKNFNKGSKVASFSGKVRPKGKGVNTMTWTPQTVLSSENTQDSVGRYARRVSGQSANTRTRKKKNKMDLVARRKIKKGEEITTHKS